LLFEFLKNPKDKAKSKKTIKKPCFLGLLAFEKLAEQGFGRKELGTTEQQSPKIKLGTTFFAEQEFALEELGTTFAVSPASNDYALLSKHASHLLREFKKP